MTLGLSHGAALRLKTLLYGRRGEPFPLGDQVLRYAPGTRPVRARYETSPNDSVRYDALQVRLFREGLSEGDTAIDIGAHAGQYALIMAAMCGNSGHVTAFEPDPYARQLLQRNIALNPRIKAPTIEALAVSGAPGEAVLYSRGGNSQSSLARSGVGQAGIGAEAIKVRVVTLDSYLVEQGLPEPRWIKIDTEGAEIGILKGAPKLLAGRSNIVCELHPYAWAEFGDSFDELQRLAAACGRRIRYLDETTEVSADVRYGTVLLERPTGR
jgi:FkbM family methyltransferase